MNMDEQEKQKEIEEFFKDAFCAKSAEILFEDVNDFSVGNVIKINTGDKRGTIYIAYVFPK